MGRGFEPHQGCTIYHLIWFRLFKELFTFENWCCCPRTPGILCTLYKQNIYIYQRSQYPKPWIEKCHIPVALRLEHHSTCDRGVVGSSPIRGMLFFPFIRFRLCQEQLFTAKTGCCCPRTTGLYINEIYICSMVTKWSMFYLRFFLSTNDLKLC